MKTSEDLTSLSSTLDVSGVSHPSVKSLQRLNLKLRETDKPTDDKYLLEEVKRMLVEYRGEDEKYGMTLCIAWTGAMMWEIVEPTGGRTIYDDFLDQHGEGIQHVAFAGRQENGAEMPYDDQIAEFVKRGFPVIQSGLIAGEDRFHYFDTEKATSTTFETYSIKGGELPEPDGWYPAPPPA